MDSPQPKASKFPIAHPVKPLFEIGGKIYQRVPHSDGITNADAIRGQVPILSGPDKGGWKVGWFVLLFDPTVVQTRMGPREFSTGPRIPPSDAPNLGMEPKQIIP